MNDCVIYLRSQETTKNSKGFDVLHDLPERKVYAELRSVGRTEFYAAQQAKKRVDKIFRLRVADYRNESIVRHEDTSYDVVRTYRTGSDFIELTCARR